MKARAALFAAGALMVAACGSSGKPSATQSTSALHPASSSAASVTPSSPSPAVVNHDPVTKRYMDQLASLATTHDATLTKPGSLAATYAEYNATIARADNAMGLTGPPGTVTKVAEGSWLLAFSDGLSYTFSAFQYDIAGRIMTFSVNSRPLAGRLARGNDVSGGGVTLSHIISHQSANGVSYVVFDARNTRSDQAVRIEYRDYNVPPTLVSLSGQQFGHDVANSAGPTELQPGAASSYAIAFHAPDCGKQFRIELLPSVSLNEVYVSTSLHQVS